LIEDDSLAESIPNAHPSSNQFIIHAFARIFKMYFYCIGIFGADFA